MPRLTPRDVLTDVFGYVDFRPGQEKIIATVLSGRDCIGVMPTGAGKSLTFQIPTPEVGPSPPYLSLSHQHSRRRHPICT